MQIETNNTATNWMKNIAGEDFEHIIVFRYYGDVNEQLYTNLRDREPEMRNLFRHYPNVTCKRVKGYELKEAGWELAGAQLVQTFKIMLIK